MFEGTKEEEDVTQPYTSEYINSIKGGFKYLTEPFQIQIFDLTNKQVHFLMTMFQFPKTSCELEN